MHSFAFLLVTLGLLTLSTLSTPVNRPYTPRHYDEDCRRHDGPHHHGHDHDHCRDHDHHHVHPHCSHGDWLDHKCIHSSSTSSTHSVTRTSSPIHSSTHLITSSTKVPSLSATQSRIASSSVTGQSTSTSSSKASSVQMLSSSTSIKNSSSSSKLSSAGTSSSIPSSSSSSKTLSASSRIESSTTSSRLASSSVKSSATALPTGKRGIADRTIENFEHFNDPGSKVTWGYNWGSTIPPNFPSYLEYVPMLFGSTHAVWKTNVDLAIARGSKHLLAFNEPDGKGPGQANMTPSVAADDYMTYIQPYAGEMRLGGPAVVQGASGLVWLDQFIGNCTRCTIDFLPIHIYDGPNVTYFQNIINKMHTKYSRPIWITEFSMKPSDQQEAFLETMLPWLDGQSFVERYAWFNNKTLTLPDGSLTSLGKTYELL